MESNKKRRPIGGDNRIHPWPIATTYKWWPGPSLCGPCVTHHIASFTPYVRSEPDISSNFRGAARAASQEEASQEKSLGRASGGRGASYSLVLAAIVKPWAVQPCAHVAICDQSRRAPPCGYPKARCPEADSVPGCPRCGQYAPYTRGLYRKRGGVKFCGLLLAQICAAQQLCFRFRFVSVYSCLLT